MTPRSFLLASCLAAAAALAITFQPPPDAADESTVTMRDDHGRREGRIYFISNGTAVVNKTSVSLALGFATIVGLGVASVFHEAATRNFPTAPGGAADDNDVSAKVDKEVRRRQQQHELNKYHREMEQYEVEYRQYLRDYAAWAEVFGQDPTPPEGRKKRYKREKIDIGISGTISCCTPAQPRSPSSQLRNIRFPASSPPFQSHHLNPPLRHSFLFFPVRGFVRRSHAKTENREEKEKRNKGRRSQGPTRAFLSPLPR